MFGILLFLLYLLLGAWTAVYLFDGESMIRRFWLGGVTGMMLFVWSHVPFSFLLGFTVGSHLLGLLLTVALAALLVLGKTGVIFRGEKGKNCPKKTFSEALTAPFRGKIKWIEDPEISMLACVVPFMIISVALLCNHTLVKINGAYYTGQCTYGDMNMHLGFITSIAEQHMFPPTYSIIAGEPLNYPFLCDSVSSSLYLFGTSLRAAYIIPAVFAFLFVYMGIWYVAMAVLKKPGRASLAFIMFVLDGGFGLMYFLDGSNAKEMKNFTRIFTEFYQTPTNLTTENVRWTNILADMLLPQRATLFGWCCLFAVIYVLLEAVFDGKKQYFLIAGVLAGLLPLIHTHSYFSIGLIAVAWILTSCFRDRFRKDIIFSWLKFGIPALLLSVPQLIVWTFNAVGGESFLRFVFNWVNNGAGDSWLWFWVKNLGFVFLLIPTAFLASSKEKRCVYAGGFLIFAVAEFIIFQPNLYDNIKLFFIWYFFMAVMCADLLAEIYARLKDIRGRQILAVLMILALTVSGGLTVVREVVSGYRNPETDKGYAYQLYNKANVDAAEWIRENTEPDSVFLAYNNHNNAISSLTGRNIYVGAGTFLYYHGVHYQDKERLMREMMTDAASFEANREAAGIDYVYVGDYERANFGSSLITDYLRLTYETVYSAGGIEIFRVGD